MDLDLSLGILGIFIAIILAIIGIWFGIVTATAIATAVGVTGLDWWIVSLTIFSALGGGVGSLVRVNKD
jgi:hypothetical protein